MALTTHQQEDVTFIKRVGHWLRWSTLPMKHKDGRSGFMYDRQPIGSKLDLNHESLRTVILMNPWDLPQYEGKISAIPVEKFETVEAMIEAGWMVA